MGKSKRLRKRLQAFVDGLTPDEAREQLVLAYLQMEKCISVLRGYDVEPVGMLDNGECTDLELFYRCKKVRAELDLAEKENLHADNAKTGGISYRVSLDTSDIDRKLEHVKDTLSEIDKLCSKIVIFK